MIVFANFILNIILVQFLQEGGIALATAITAIANFFILFWLIQKNIGKWERSDLSHSFLVNGVITILMGTVCYLTLVFFPYQLQDAAKENLLLVGLMRLFIPLFVGIIFYMLVTAILKRPELKELWQGLGLRKSQTKD
jgi:putative peptidoglycan lipid II flippase